MPPWDTSNNSFGPRPAVCFNLLGPELQPFRDRPTTVDRISPSNRLSNGTDECQPGAVPASFC